MPPEVAFTESDGFSKLAWLVVAMVLAAAASGCQQSAGPAKPVPVSGKVTLNQRPVSFATIEFVPKPSGSARSAPVTDGQFSLPLEAGLTAGEYSVRIRPYSPEIEEFQSLPPDKRQAVVASRRAIPPAYDRDGVLSAQISADSPNELTFELKSR